MYDDFFLERDNLYQTHDLEVSEAKSDFLMQLDKETTRKYNECKKKLLESELRYHSGLVSLLREEVNQMNAMLYPGDVAEGAGA